MSTYDTSSLCPRYLSRPPTLGHPFPDTQRSGLDVSHGNIPRLPCLGLLSACLPFSALLCLSLLVHRQQATTRAIMCYSHPVVVSRSFPSIRLPLSWRFTQPRDTLTHHRLPPSPNSPSPYMSFGPAFDVFDRLWSRRHDIDNSLILPASALLTILKTPAFVPGRHGRPWRAADGLPIPTGASAA